MKKEILRMENVISESSERTNLNNFSLQMFQGEIFGLLGLNEQGRDMLIALLERNSPIKFGRIYINEQLVNSYRYSSGADNKVYVIGQTSKLVNDLTVADNVFVLRKGFRKYILNQKVLARQLCRILEENDICVDPNALCGDLSEYERCVVELMRAVIQGVHLIIVNDISNILSARDMEDFQELLVSVSRDGRSVFYIGNHHEEVFSICSRAAFMQDGKIVKVFDKKEMTDEKAMRYALSYEDTNPVRIRKENRSRIEFCGINTETLKDVSFVVEGGECCVLFDKSNKVQPDIIHCLCGESKWKSGCLRIDFQALGAQEVHKCLGKEIAVIGEEALKSMLFYDMSYLDNLCFLLDKKTNRSRITEKVKRSIRREYYGELGDDLFVSDLYRMDKKSLYNLIYYRIHLLGPKLVFIVQPFSNADMFLRRHIVHLIRILKRKGIAVVILAVSISDSLFVADRFMLLEKGRIEQEFLPDSFSKIRTGSYS